MKKDDDAPATKKDISMVMDSIGKLYIANEGWKNEILAKSLEWKDEILNKQKEWKGETKEQFDIIAENIHHDVSGANKDEIEVLKD
ncbi:hypothetical protein KKF03_02780, partial [Patescibacteria group bacterium]|nr:hypothetical protein [Patescibacteria group bacterium]